MKKILASLVLAGLAAAAFAQTAPAPVNQIDLGFGYYGTDITGVYANNQTSGTYGQSAKYSPSLNGSGKYTFTYKLDDADTLKFGLGYDGWWGLYSGGNSTTTAPGGSPSSSTNAGEAGQNAGKVTPFGEWIGYGADVVLSFPIYYFGPADNGGFNEFKYAYGEAGYFPVTTNKNGQALSNNVVSSTELVANYKYFFDKTTWVLGQVDTLLLFSPTPWLTFVKPKVSGSAYGAQLDLQFDYFAGYADGSTSGATPAYTGGNNYYDLFLEPKLTYDFGFMNLVKGLKAYVASKIALATTQGSYTTGFGSGQPFHNSWIQPGAAYSFSVTDIGTFGIDAGWRFNKFDNVGSFNSAGTGYSNKVANNANYNDVVPYSELRVALSYTYKF